jgi:hypothetical protein
VCDSTLESNCSLADLQRVSRDHPHRNRCRTLALAAFLIELLQKVYNESTRLSCTGGCAAATGAFGTIC